ncbi:GTP-binding protein Rit1 [Trichoplax sp. H2]|uniref:small monomeric GTPase n=1 Tax=Trichoplax adhaerens TaxID=10228 RepID=B3S851_TRIAD|nr:hypothetical protein TRIADDRAFT_30838 [Trichoplax adhaerens]EDV21043.1 hypothetical protein TRIADDRAFT_30838 [Trichoplax adhaerens]RDD37050.1 GTP-binding protein Rit1 [Trichoplax sp. H2]|eukprot:XP_002116373.1 hypothetical protein TRIADDRAFT_30838 [Trichoplax adhaerens]
MDKSSKRTASGLRVYKIVLLGEGGVGKSAVTLQFVNHSFVEHHDPTIEDAYQQQAVIDGEAGLLDILDTAGQEEFTSMREQYMRGGEGFILVYSITDRRSFEEISNYITHIERVRNCNDTPIVIVGNKSDLEHQRVVSTTDGQTLARQHNCSFWETSAALRQFIDESFHGIVRKIREKEKITAANDKSKKKSSKANAVKRLFSKHKK